MGDANVFPLDSSATNGDGFQLATRDDEPAPLADDEARHLIVRYDETTVAPTLEREFGVRGTVFNKLMKGNDTLVEVVGAETGEQYFAEVEYTDAEQLDDGDDVYVQWDRADTVAVPE